MKKNIISDEFISHLESMVVNMHQPMKGFFGGIHKTNSYGSTVEFADFREYVLGDDLRRIDWNLYSRFEKHFIKLFVDEKQMHIQIFLDCSNSMNGNNKKKAEQALKITTALGYLAVHNMDKVSVNLIQGDIANSLYGTMCGKDAFFQSLSLLEETKFKGESNLKDAIINCTTNGSNDGLSIIISDFLTDNDWKSAVDYLLYKKREVMLVHLLSTEEMNPAYNGRMVLIDSESHDKLDEKNMKMKISKSEFESYQRALSDFLGDMKAFCAGRQMSYLLLNSDENIEKSLFEQLYEMEVVK